MCQANDDDHDDSNERTMTIMIIIYRIILTMRTMEDMMEKHM